jgi:hypothetical protein
LTFALLEGAREQTNQDRRRTTYCRSFPTTATCDNIVSTRRFNGGTINTIQGIPVIYAIVNVVIILHHFGKEFAQEVIIGRFLETKFADIIEVDAELLCTSHDETGQKEPNKVIGLLQFTRIAFAKFLYKRCLLLLTDLFVLLLVRRRFETLPRQASAKEVHKNVTERLEIITSRLFCRMVQKSELRSNGQSSHLDPSEC